MINQYTLENGIKVVFEQNKHFNSATIGVWIGVGSRDEDKNNNGIGSSPSSCWSNKVLII